MNNGQSSLTIFLKVEALSLAIDGPFAQGLASEADNLVLRAARALSERCPAIAAAHIRLTKNLPVASA